MNVASVVNVLASVAWLLVVGGVVFAGYNVARGGSARSMVGLVLGAIVLAILLSVASAGLVFVPPQERGVVVSALQPTGIRQEALQPGLRWIIPFFETVVPYPISKQTYTMSISTAEGQLQGDDSVSARTADGQEVRIDASVIFSIDPTKAVQLHIVWQGRYVDDLVRPEVRGIIRDAASQFRVDEIYSSRRAEFSTEIENELRKSLVTNGMLLDTFVLRNITFTDEYAFSIEQKQIAEQEALRAEFVVRQREQEAQQRRAEAQGIADANVIESQGRADANVIEAKGRAEANLIEAEAQAQALEKIGLSLNTSSDLLQYYYLQNLSDNVQVMLVPANSPFLFPLPDVAAEALTATPAPTTSLPEAPAEPETPTDNTDSGG
ncbi:MAG: SPFH domain-containing protein [Anaerolineales bacterium]